MANPEHLKMLVKGVNFWNKWRQQNLSIYPDLSGAKFSTSVLRQFNFSGANLTNTEFIKTNLDADNGGENLFKTGSGNDTLTVVRLPKGPFRAANFKGADLSGASLSGSNLFKAIFIDADLSEADLSSANLRWADFTDAKLRSTNLSRSDLGNSALFRTNLNSANLKEANLTCCKLLETVFANVDMSTINGLETVLHAGPSTIGFDTLYLSEGKIPEVFLRECGVPDELISYIPSLIGAAQPLQFYSCFLSYNIQDEEFAKRLHSRMRDAKLRVWFAPEDIKGGQKIYDQVEWAIQQHDRLLLVLSEQSMQSDWVCTEIRKAVKVEKKEGRRKLFPIRLVDYDRIKEWELFDAGAGKDLAEEIRSYFIPDFSNWKDHDSFEHAFKRLLQDLKAEETKQK